MAQTISTDRQLYLEQLSRADRLQQDVSRLADELKKTKNALADAIEQKQIAERRADRAVTSRNRLLDEAA